MKKLFFLTAILAVLGLSSCEKEPSKAIVGTWEAVSMEGTIGGVHQTINMADTPMSIEFVFNEDGTGYARMEMGGEGENAPFQYGVKGNILLFTEDGTTAEIPITLEKDTMTMEIGSELIEEEDAKIVIYLHRK